jgi:aryl-alcohol dehydrogenase-like predicted oxidoreductase
MSDDMQKEIDRVRPQIEAYESLCAEIAETPADVALAWMLQNPVVTAPIIGPRTMQQLHGNLHALEIVLTQDIMQRLDQIWPGPGGEAPEAYAW